MKKIRKKTRKLVNFILAPAVVVIAGVVVIAAIIIVVLLLPKGDSQNEPNLPATYSELSRLSDEQKALVETAKNTKGEYVLGMVYSGECFTRADGSIGGFGQLLCAWMSIFFDIKVTPRLYVSAVDLLADFEAEDVDFALRLPPKQDYEIYSSGTVSSRYLKIARLTKREPSSVMRVVYRSGSSTASMVVPSMIAEYGDNYSGFSVATNEEAIAALRENKADVFIADNVVMGTLVFEPGITTEVFSPITYINSNLCTKEADLQPLVNAFDDFLSEGGRQKMDDFAARGNADFLRLLFISELTPVEKELYDSLIKSGANISVLYDNNNYPVSYYDNAAKAWRGIAQDTLERISGYTSLKFSPGQTPTEDLSSAYNRFKEGEIDMAAELLRRPERTGAFIWADEPYSSARYALLYNDNGRQWNYADIWGARVGIIEETGYGALFSRYFPNHNDSITYPDVASAVKALSAGEIDMLMASENIWLSACDWLGYGGFKALFPFSETVDSAFGFTANESALRGIISKATRLVSLDDIKSFWANRSFDYKPLITKSQSFSAVVLIIAGVIVFALTVALYVLRRTFSKRLVAEVNNKTAALLEKRRENEKQTHIRSTFWANTCIEMRTPLNAVIGLSELSLGEGDVDDATKKNLEGIYNSGMMLISLVNDIMDISKLEAGTFSLNEAPYDVPSLINDTAVMNTAKSGSRAITFSMIISPDIPAKLIGDELRIKQIFNNLLSNAFKFTKEGSVEWSVSSERDGDDCLIISTVKDTGYGIRPDRLETIFDDYEYAREGKVAGSGLGLAITKKIVEMNGGTISVESVFGRGSAFTVRFRQRVAEEAPIGDTVALNLKKFRYSDHKRDRSARFARAYIPYAKVLIVDDMKMNIDLARGILKPYGMRVDSALSGREAIEIVRRQETRYNAIFMDHMMPGMDGVRATRIIRAEIGTQYAQTVPIIALTADAVVGYEEMFLQNGFSSFISKPIDILKMDEIINRYVRDRELERGLLSAADHYAKEAIHARVLEGCAVEGLDMERAIGRFNDDEDAYINVLRSFVANTPPLLEQIRDIDAADANDYAVVTHGLKGSLRSIGANALGAQAEALNRAAKQRDKQRAQSLNERFINGTTALIGRVGELIKYIAQEAEKPTKNAPDEAQLERLLLSCRDYDVDAAEEAISDLAKYHYESDNDLVVWLKGRVAVMAYKQIVDRLTARKI